MRQGFAKTAVKWENRGPGEMYGYPTVTPQLPGGYPTGSPEFALSRKAPDTAPLELASNCVRPAAALRENAAT